jgi:hypothetical protein
MKPGCCRLIIGLIILGLSAASCSSGGGSSGGGFSSLHPPSLSGLSIDPDSAVQNAGSGTIQVNFNFDFTDAGGDLFSMTVTVYDGKGTELGSGTDQFKGASGITKGYVNGALNADTRVAGNYKIEFYVTDSAGSKSNKISAVFTVIPAASLVSIAVTPANPTIQAGTEQQFTATGTYSDSTILDITGLVTWTSSDEKVALINYMGRQGLARAENGGFATITATKGGISGYTVLTVQSDFGPAVNYPGIQYQYLANTAIGDLNGDGRNDVAVLQQFGNSVFIYYQKADHTMDTVQVIYTDLTVRGVAIADVDHDGLAELIVSGDTKIYVYKQDAVTHALGSPQAYPVSVMSASGLVVADLNNDGLPDIVVSGTDAGGSGVISMLFQNANGTLASEVTYTAVPVYAGGELHVADMNNDGLNDIVIQSSAKQLAVIKQVSAGTFSTAPDYYTVQTNYWPSFNSFALGDLNGDGRTDIAVSDPTGNLNIFLQNDSGQLSGPTILSGYSSEIHIADLDGDGLNDIILLNDGYWVTVLYQGQDHSFTNAKNYFLPTASEGGTVVHQAMSIGDVTGDGLPDIVASWSDEGIFVLPHLP